jgi:predicted DNA-binding transcriptional regulator AlpA
MSQEQQYYLMTLAHVLQAFPVSESTWWAGIRLGKYPRPVRLSPRRVAWKSSDIRSLIDQLSEEYCNEPNK